MEFQHIGQLNNQSVHDHRELSGFSAVQRSMGAARARRVREAGRLMANVLQGKEDPFLLREAMYPRHDYAVTHLMENYPGLYTNQYGDKLGLRETMSVTDFTALYVDVLDRQFYGYYNAAPIPNMPLVKKVTLRDFRSVKRFLVDGMTTPLDIVQNGTPPPERALGTETVITYAPDLYAARTSVNWRAIVNDDLGVFQDIPMRLTLSAQRRIQKSITGLYCDTNGPHASLYTAAFTNIINIANGATTNNPALSIQGLQDAMNVLAKMLDADGQPIVLNGAVNLWYGPALEATAKNLMNMVNAQLSVNGGITNAQGFPSQFIQINNWVIQGLNPIMDQYIPIVVTTGSRGATSWGLTYSPAAQNRPSVEFGFLAGFETPQLFQKVPNTMRVGGGVDPMMGDFLTMDQELKIITAFGGKQVDGRSTVASNGSGA